MREPRGRPALNTRDAVALIEGAVPRHPGTWADLGAGDGTFTRALAQLLRAGNRIYAVDRNAGAAAALERLGRTDGVNVVPVAADFTRTFELPGLGRNGLDGMLLAGGVLYVAAADRHSERGPLIDRRSKSD